MEYEPTDEVIVEDGNGNELTGEVTDTESHRQKEMVEVETAHGTGWFFTEDVEAA